MSALQQFVDFAAVHFREASRLGIDVDRLIDEDIEKQKRVLS